MNRRVTVEIAVDSLEDAVAAQQGGAHRLELCSDLAQDGLSPSPALLAAVRAAVSIPVFVMVRPRAGGFQYTDKEAAEMARQIERCKEEGADGIVLGLLDAERNIDIVRTQKLIGLAAPLSVTFHRAFDGAAEPFNALEGIIACGATRLLTSGQKETAIAGKGTIRGLAERSNGRIIILPGAGIDASNVKELTEIPGITEVHLSKGVKRKDAHGDLSVDPRLVESFIAGINA
ncbi:MAG: copper homeostasis protein CutC [Bacteroidetes bacterium]|nr:copper homeostasis protein CutC [Bacteroidota bacterium]